MTTSVPRSPLRSSDLAALIARATAADGTPPFSDGALVELARGEREAVWLRDAAALVSATEAEFVVDPDSRGDGLGTELLALLEARGDLKFWAHGDHPAARALARSHGYVPVRELLHLEAPVAGSRLRTTTGAGSRLRSTTGAGARLRTTTEAGSRLRTTTGIPDRDALLDLNARAFAHHPEQGSLSRADLDVLMAEPWFDPEDVLFLCDDDTLVGFCWLKVTEGEGEFYVVGVDPAHQGSGYGRMLVEAGLSRLASRGIRIAHLYVEADNAPAVRLYRSFGFTDRGIDIQYMRANQDTVR